MLENAVEIAVCAEAEKRGWLCRKFAYIGRRNGPDRLFAKGGRVVFIEFKQPGKEPRPGQAREHDRLRDAGVETHVIDSVRDGLALLP